MAEWRAIYASLYHDARVKHLSVKGRYVYIATIVNANDNGSLPWDAQQLAKWADVSASVALAAMEQLEASGLLTIANGRASHPQWDVYQWMASKVARERARPRASAPAAGAGSTATDRQTDIQRARARARRDIHVTDETAPEAPPTALGDAVRRLAERMQPGQ
jgi:hypothetical protein